MDSMAARKLVEGIITSLPTHRRAVTDEEVTYSDLSGRVHHLKILIKIKPRCDDGSVITIEPPPAVFSVALAPVVEYFPPARVVYAAPAPVVNYTAPASAPVVEQVHCACASGVRRGSRWAPEEVAYDRRRVVAHCDS